MKADTTYFRNYFTFLSRVCPELRGLRDYNCAAQSPFVKPSLGEQIRRAAAGCFAGSSVVFGSVWMLCGVALCFWFCLARSPWRLVTCHQAKATGRMGCFARSSFVVGFVWPDRRGCFAGSSFVFGFCLARSPWGVVTCYLVKATGRLGSISGSAACSIVLEGSARGGLCQHVDEPVDPSFLLP